VHVMYCVVVNSKRFCLPVHRILSASVQVMSVLLQSIKTHLYSAICHERIRAAYLYLWLSFACDVWHCV